MMSEPELKDVWEDIARHERDRADALAADNARLLAAIDEGLTGTDISLAVRTVEEMYADNAALRLKVQELKVQVKELVESRDAWKASQECSEKAYMALVNQIPAERFDYDPINVALLDGAKEQEVIGRKQIAELQATLDTTIKLSNAVLQERDELQDRLTTLETLVLRLPAVDGVPRVVEAATDEYHVYDAIFTTRETAEHYAALLTHRQGMEG
jgi:hypothetical protein